MNSWCQLGITLFSTIGHFWSWFLVFDNVPPVKLECLKDGILRPWTFVHCNIRVFVVVRISFYFCQQETDFVSICWRIGNWCSLMFALPYYLILPILVFFYMFSSEIGDPVLFHRWVWKFPTQEGLPPSTQILLGSFNNKEILKT